MGLIPSSELTNSKAPFVDAAAYLFSGNWHLLISLIASVVCIGTLNAWILTSGQIALGLAQNHFLPKRFTRTNKNGAPSLGILWSSIGIVPLLLLTNSDSLAKQITDLIDISVISFLFVYIACAFGLLKILRSENQAKATLASVAAVVAILFCFFVIYQTPATTLLISSLFTLSGLPMFWRMRSQVRS
jgi:APA family basic amino acid/polyamine antiporter